MTTYYIVPAWSDQAGQCRIVSFEGDPENAPRHYKENQASWKEVGLMNSRGDLIYLNASPEAIQEFKDCEPLMAGLVVKGN